MPDLLDCEQDANGNLWCYDNNDNCIVEIIVKKRPMGIVPKAIMDSILEKQRKLFEGSDKEQA